MKSRVHPKYKTRYRVTNWRDYERGLVQRGDVTIWLSPEALDMWKAKPSGRRGAQPKFLDLAIETALTMRLVFHLPLRQIEGFLRSLFKLMDVALEVPDHTTLSRRSANLKVSLVSRTSSGPIDLIIDSSGLAIVGEGEWAVAKHGGNGRRGWKKLHLGVDATGEIVAQVLTNSNVDDGTAGVGIIKNVSRPIRTVTADAAYDTKPIYDAAKGMGAEVVVPPSSIASTSTRRRRSKARNRTVMRVKEVGRRQWKKETGYHRQGRVENTFFRYKTVIGDRLRARTLSALETEAAVACNVLNRMRALGWLVSEKVAR
ncbi:MAG: IS5 family transposase [Planctomycetota bacterium]|jgi:IS5 family transposase